MKNLALACLLMFVLSGCGQSPEPNAAKQDAAPLQKIVVAYTVQPQSTLIHVAVAKGYFREEGLDVESSIHTFGKASLQTLLERKSNFAAVAETPFMFNVLKGEKIYMIANMEATSHNNAIVARKDAGVRVGADLKGKRIGFTPGTTSDFFLDTMLPAIGLKRDDVKVVPLKPEEMQEAILAKTVDAVCTWNFPLIKIRKALGDNATVIADPDIFTETFNIAAQQDYVKSNPETVQRFLRALIKAEGFVEKNSEEVQALMSAASSTDPALVREVWTTFKHHVGLDNKLLLTLEDEARWAIKNKLTEQTVVPDFRDYIHADSLRAVKPDAVKFNR